MLTLAVAAAGLVLYASARQSITQAVHQNLEAVALLKSNYVQYWLNDQRQDATLALGTPLFTGEFELWRAGGMRDGQRRARLLAYLRAVADAKQFLNISIRDAADGTLLLSSAGRDDTALERRDARSAAMTMKTVIEDLHEVPGEPDKVCVDFYFPIGETRPRFIADVEAYPSQSLFGPLQLWPGTSPSAETMLIKAEGDSVVFLSDLRHAAGAALHLRQPMARADLIAAKAARGEAGALAGIDYRDVPSLGYALPIDGTDWVLTTKIDQAEAYAPLNTSALAAAVVTVVLLLAAAAWTVERQRAGQARAAERKRLDGQLRASENRFRQAFEHAPIGMAILDFDGRIMASNPAMCRLMGYSEADLADRTILEITHPDDRDRDATWLGAPGDQGESCVFEKRGIRKDGRIVHLSVCRTLVRDTDGEPLYAISQIQDVGERMEAIARIERLSQLKAAISEINRAIVRSRAPDEVFSIVCRACVERGGFRLAWIGVADAETRRIVPIAMAGPASAYLDGILVSTDADLPEGRGPTAIAYREQRVHICNDFSADPAVAPWRERARAQGLASSIGLPLARGGQPYGTLTAYGPERSFFDDEAIGLLQEMADNISFALDQFEREAQRRQYEGELRRSEEKFRTLAENLPQNVFVMNADLVFVSCNEPYAKRLGIAAEQIAGKRDSDFYPPALAEKYERDSRRVLETGEIMDMHEECTADGEPRFVHTIKAPVRNGQGDIVGVLGVFWDITATKRAELRLEDLSHRLVAVQEDERRRLAAQLHDRLMPNLAAIKVILATLGVSLAGEAREAVMGPVQDAEALLDDTTIGVRDICAELRPTLLDYAGLIPALHGYAAQFKKRTSIAVHVVTPDDGTRLDSETESTLFRITQEALTNCARHACAKNITVDLDVSDDDVRLTIRDDGFGFDPDALGRSEDAPGLGLITMKERAEFAGGRFMLCTNPLEGTEIKVELNSCVRLSPDATPSHRRAAL